MKISLRTIGKGIISSKISLYFLLFFLLVASTTYLEARSFTISESENYTFRPEFHSDSRVHLVHFNFEPERFQYKGQTLSVQIQMNRTFDIEIYITPFGGKHDIILSEQNVSSISGEYILETSGELYAVITFDGEHYVKGNYSITIEGVVSSDVLLVIIFGILMLVTNVFGVLNYYKNSKIKSADTFLKSTSNPSFWKEYTMAMNIHKDSINFLPLIILYFYSSMNYDRNHLGGAELITTDFSFNFFLNLAYFLFNFLLISILLLGLGVMNIQTVFERNNSEIIYIMPISPISQFMAKITVGIIYIVPFTSIHYIRNVYYFYSAEYYLISPYIYTIAYFLIILSMVAVLAIYYLFEYSVNSKLYGVFAGLVAFIYILFNYIPYRSIDMDQQLENYPNWVQAHQLLHIYLGLKLLGITAICFIILYSWSKIQTNKLSKVY